MITRLSAKVERCYHATVRWKKGKSSYKNTDRAQISIRWTTRRPLRAIIK